MRVTRNSSVESSSPKPKMMFSSFSSPMASRKYSMTSLISWARNTPPVMFTSIPVAPRMSTASRRGQCSACSAAMRPRFSPLALPDPIRAWPELRMMAETSAKSTFMSPGRRIISEMPRAALYRTSSAVRKASRMVIGPARRAALTMTLIIAECSMAPAVRCGVGPVRAWRLAPAPAFALPLSRDVRQRGRSSPAMMAFAHRPIPIQIQAHQPSSRRLLQRIDPGLRGLLAGFAGLGVEFADVVVEHQVGFALGF